MKTKPWVIKAISLSLLLAPVVLLIALYVLKPVHRSTSLPTTAIELAGLFGTASVIVAYSVWRVRWWSYVLLFIFGATVIGTDAVSIIASRTNINFFDFVDFILIGTAFFLMVRKRVREPYFNPKIRWWETPKRHRADFNGVFKINDQSITAPILDISNSGCFVDLKTNVSVGENLKLEVKEGVYSFQSDAQVVRQSDDPKGIGLMFMNLSKPDRRQIKQFIKSLNGKSTQ